MKKRFDAKVLVVDDSASVTSLIREVLLEVVSSVEIAETGGDAIRRLKDKGIDLVLLDHRLPDMSGTDMVRSLSGQEVKVPFVTITGHGDEKVAVEMMKLGAHDYLTKDENFLTLLPSVVRRVLNQLETESRLKIAEEELVAEEVRYRELFDHMSSGVAVMAADDENGDEFVILDYNRAAARISGLSKAQVVGKGVSGLFPGVAGRFLQVFRRVLKTGKAESLPEIFYQDDPMAGWRQCYVHKLPSGEIVVMFDDITEQKQAENALRASEEKYKSLYNEFQTLLDGIPDGLSLLDPDFKVVWCNSSFAERFGRSAEELRNRYCFEIWHKLDVPCDDCPVQACFDSGEIQDRLRRSGSHIFGVKAFPLKDETGKTVNVINLCSDVTEKIRLREESAQASRLASLGELAAGVAHEINNPNAMILLNSPILEEVWSAAAPILAKHFRENGDFKVGALPYSRVRDEVPRLQSEIGDAAKRIKAIVDDLKNFVRQGDDDVFEIVDLNTVGEKAARLAGNAISKATHHFLATYHSALPPVNGNFGRLEQVVVNLLLNACQALPSPDRELSLSTRFDASRNQVVLEVRDQGCGIRPEDLPRLTDPFFTTRRKDGGTGLGLSVSARIAEEHGGALKFDSTPGEETVVSLVLPATRTY